MVCSSKEAKLAVDAVLKTTVKTLKKGQTVTLAGLGTFKIAKRAARKGGNPRTVEPVKIKASKKPKFTAGKIFKDALK